MMGQAVGQQDRLFIGCSVSSISKNAFPPITCYARAHSLLAWTHFFEFWIWMRKQLEKEARKEVCARADTRPHVSFPDEKYASHTWPLPKAVDGVEIEINGMELAEFASNPNPEQGGEILKRS